MKTAILLATIASVTSFCVPNDSLEAKSRVSFGVNVNAVNPAPQVYYVQPPVVVRRPAPVYYQEHVPVGQGHSQPVVVYQAAPVVVREEVVVYPVRPAPRWYNFFSFNWRLFN